MTPTETSESERPWVGQGDAGGQRSELLKNPWRSHALGIWSITAMTCGLGLLLMPFNERSGSLALGLAAIGALIALMVTYYAGRVGTQLLAFGRGEHLAHWTYTPDEWGRFLSSPLAPEHALKRRPHVVRVCAAVTGLLYGLVLSTLLSAPTPGADEDDLKAFALFLSGLLVGGAAGWIAGWIVGGLALWIRGRTVDRAPRRREAYVGRGGLYLDGTVETWAAFGLYLNSVKLLEADPPVLEFYLSDIDDNTRTVHLPVPAGREAEARKIVEEFTPR
jgi:hypothetical protein